MWLRAADGIGSSSSANDNGPAGLACCDEEDEGGQAGRSLTGLDAADVAMAAALDAAKQLDATAALAARWAATSASRSRFSIIC